MVDEGASKAPGRKSVWVRVPPPAVRPLPAAVPPLRHSASILGPNRGARPIDGQRGRGHTAPGGGQNGTFQFAGRLKQVDASPALPSAHAGRPGLDAGRTGT